MTDVVGRFVKVVLGYAEQRTAELQSKHGKLAHYTTAATGQLILENQELWMRSPSVMNDSREVHHGIDVVRTALAADQAEQARLRNVLDQIDPGIYPSIIGRIDSLARQPIEHTFISSLTEHDATDERGLLSMWRAYGGETASVALVFNSDFLTEGPEVLQAFGSPVFYGDFTKFADEFSKFVDRLEQNMSLMQCIDASTIEHIIYFALEAAVLSMKHDGFQEEREWRIIHRPFVGRGSAWMLPAVKTVWGVPQIIYRLPLANKAGLNAPILNMKALLYKLIVGPSVHPQAVRLGFVQQLIELGFAPEVANARVVISDIPLRKIN